MASSCPFTTNVGVVMSNFDHVVEPDAIERLNGEVYGEYPGWNFHGRVWLDAATKQYRCEVWTYGAPRRVLAHATLAELMEEVSDIYGEE